MLAGWDILSGRRLRSRRGRSPAAGGQVLVIALLALTLLVGLVFFVYNLGDSINRRLAMQNASDAVAVSGGGWMARSMNLVAMNNIAQSRMVALVPILDALPLAAEMAYNEVSAWQQCLAGQLARGVPVTKDDYLQEGLESLRKRMAEQRDILQPVDEKLNNSSFDMELTTHWLVRGRGGAVPHGSLWKAAVALDEFSQATAASAGVLAQADAVRFGRSDDVDAAFLVPIEPKMPARRGGFVDFRPVMEGRLAVRSDRTSYRASGGRGGAIPDYAYPHRIGPWARLFRWRDELRRTTGREWVPGGTPTKVRGGRGNVNVGGRRVGGSARTSPGGGGHWRRTGWEVIGYTAYGPYEWALRRINWNVNRTERNPGPLRDTYFYDYLRRISRIKLDYMFKSRTPKTVHYPQWIGDYPRARNLAAEPTTRITRTMFYLVEIASAEPEDSPSYLSPGTYRTNGSRPTAIWVDGWADPADWHIEQKAQWVWKDKYTYETTRDPQLGLNLQRDPVTGREVWHTVYMTAWYVFGGIDVGGDVDVSNPANWDQYDEPPAPMLLDTSVGDYDPFELDGDRGVRREYFTYLGVVRKRSGAPIWPQKFSNVNPTGSMITLAQAQVFNNTSWDLWTQDWRVQLVPITQWDQWVSRLHDGVVATGPPGGSVQQSEVDNAYEYMSRLNEEMAELYLNH